MAKTVAIKIPSDIEYRVISNAFGLMFASAGLLAGAMVQQRSFGYWRDDIVMLLIVAWLGFRLFRNLLSTLMLYQDQSPPRPRKAPSGASPVMPEQVIAGQIPAVTVPSAEQVVEEVAKRIEAKRMKAEQSNKFTK
ncbi:MAG: hypothetical protein A2X82_10160 [Geobacteraceae bacterium GWC2_55_20]|nr:MAG: hypothetical protein A2X82_10160 [Geobacteraceae bacterium GWC2_55_20]HBA73451.1 hypothetical protein [Geobacter sp.]HCE68128.1 hypothetical protein [Geobacter sp.]